MGNESNIINIRRSDYSSQCSPIRLPFLYLPCNPLAAFFTEIQRGWFITQSYRQGGVYTHLKHRKRQNELSCPVYHVPYVKDTNVSVTDFRKQSRINIFLVKSIQPKTVFPIQQFKCDQCGFSFLLLFAMQVTSSVKKCTLIPQR